MPPPPFCNTKYGSSPQGKRGQQHDLTMRVLLLKGQGIRRVVEDKKEGKSDCG